jgi:hypothetical protein
MEIFGKTYVFDNDDELADFCINADPAIRVHKKLGVKYFDYDMTPQYYEACDEGITFAVRDPKSRAVKNGHLCRGVITKKIECIPWDEYDEMDYADDSVAD